MYGNKIAVSEYHPRRSVIGALDTTSSGNVVLRIGGQWTDNPERGWQQTEHVVLKPMEVSDLIRELAEHMQSKASREVVHFRLDRELAQLVLDKLNGNAVRDDRYDVFHERLADFVNPE